MIRRPYAVLIMVVVALGSLTWATHRIFSALDNSEPAAATPQVFQSVLMNPSTQPTDQLRCAVIGGMTFTGFWQALSDRYQTRTGIALQVLSTGEKNDIAKAFRAGGIDVITMHASDTIINLVADGDALDPQPWMRNDLIIVGPESDPAKIVGMTDAAAALRKIIAAKAPFVIHSSLGAQEVLRNICNFNGITMDPDHTTILLDDPQRQVLHIAAAKGAYTLVGRIPFRIGRLPSVGMKLMVSSDEHLRRPYIIAVANPAKIAGVRFKMAKHFAAFLREPETQAWIAGYGKGQIDNQPLFFPVSISLPKINEDSTTLPSTSPPNPGQ